MSWQTAGAKATRQIDDCLKIVKTFLMPTYGFSFHVFPVPVHPAVAMLYAAHESGVWNKKLKRWECLRWVKTNYPEIGLLQLTMKRGDNEVATWGIHPLDPHSHIWAAQESFAEGVDLTKKVLAQYGYKPFLQLSALHATALLLLVRSVGCGCTRGLLKMGARTAMDSYRPFHAMAAWLKRDDADTTPFDGAQDTETVRLRFLWCWQCCTRAPEIGIGHIGEYVDLPDAPRPSGLMDLPADFQRNVATYIAAAKREGFKPTGPWPTGVVV